MKMNKINAVGYIRVSTGKQAKDDKASLEIQERDIREYCEKNGYSLVEIYKDIQTGSDRKSQRKNYLRMIQDIDNGGIDVVIAWLQDRLFRGINYAMVDLLTRVNDQKVNVELVKENFDPRLAGFVAIVGGLDLDYRKQRMISGIAKRLSMGKVLPRSIPYGYSIDENGYSEIDPEESKWVRLIWDEYAKGESVGNIRNHLIENNAPMRISNAKIPWAKSRLYKILNTKDPYVSGIQVIEWDNETFEIAYPVIIDQQTAKQVEVRRRKAKSHPARNVKHNYLVNGLVYCKGCNIKLGARLNYKTYSYQCYYHSRGYNVQNCCKSISSDKVDKFVWSKIEEILLGGLLGKAIKDQFDRARKESVDTQKDIEKLEKKLERLNHEKDLVIRYARKRLLDPEELEKQLTEANDEINDVQKELTRKRLATANIDDLESHLNAAVTIPHPKVWHFWDKKNVTHKFVERITIDHEKNIEITFKIDLRENTQSNKLHKQSKGVKEFLPRSSTLDMLDPPRG
jgi:site-specific DNA recombinase